MGGLSLLSPLSRVFSGASAELRVRVFRTEARARAWLFRCPPRPARTSSLSSLSSLPLPRSSVLVSVYLSLPLLDSRRLVDVSSCVSFLLLALVRGGVDSVCHSVVVDTVTSVDTSSPASTPPSPQQQQHLQLGSASSIHPRNVRLSLPLRRGGDGLKERDRQETMVGVCLCRSAPP